MCGIIGYTGKNFAVPYLIRGLEKLEYRGYDSSGIALWENGGVRLIKASGKLSCLKEKTSHTDSSALCGIGHTRWATHGKPDETNAHPHKSSGGVFTLVHNGIIENYLPLKKELISEGFSFYSETDTEIIANLLEKLYEGDIFSALKNTAKILEGSFALSVLCKDYPDKIFALKKGSPLLVAESPSGSFAASDVTAILEYTDEVYTLYEDEICILTASGVSFYDFEGKEKKKEKEKITWTPEQAEKEGYEHFMLKEIYQQPDAVRNTFNSLVKDGLLFTDMPQLRQLIEYIDSICFIGCGSAYHAGVFAKDLTERLCRLPCRAEIASEYRYGSVPTDEKTLCIFISQSGETADTIAALLKAKEKKAKILSVVNVVGSTLARESDLVLYTKTGPEIAVATTKAYTAQLLTLSLTALLVAQVKNTLSEKEIGLLRNELGALPELLSHILSAFPEKIRQEADLFRNKNDGYFIGRGTDYSAALEGSLKMKEISYIHTEAYPAGELKHGTISLIEKGTPVVALCFQEKLAGKMLSGIKEVRARGGEVLVITKEKLRDTFSSEDHLIVLPDNSDLFSPLSAICALQLLGYYTALTKGCDIDKPRNLAKSVTVE